MDRLLRCPFLICAAIALLLTASAPLSAQDPLDLDEPIDEEILPGDELLDEEPLDEEPFDEEEPLEEEAALDEEFGDEEDLEAGEFENRWEIRITGTVRMDYVFANSEDSFTVRYRWDLGGEANAATAVIRGDANIEAEVEGPLSKWPTGECTLSIAVPKIPFELTFQRTDEENSSLRLVFRKAINEDWQSQCTFTDAPDAKFDTRGEPERWLTRALEKASPPLKSLVANLDEGETTTSFVISKQILDDAPLGNGEIEGTGVVTITPGGG